MKSVKVTARLPHVSVVIAALNAEFTIGLTLDSLENMRYSKEHLEIIVIDGGSKDRTLNVAKCFDNVKLVGQLLPREGVAGARNQGALLAKGDIVAFTDADCVVTRDWLTKIVEFYMQDKDVLGVGGVKLPLHKSFITEFMHPKHTIPLSESANCSFRREFFIRIGGFNKKIGFGAEDTELAKRILSKGYKTINSNDLVVYHLVDDNLFKFIKRYFGYSFGNLRYRFHKGKLRPSFGFPSVIFQAFRQASRIFAHEVNWKKALAFFVLTCLRGYSELLGEWWHYSRLDKTQPVKYDAAKDCKVTSLFGGN